MRSPASPATGRRRLNEPRKFSVAQHQRRASHVPATRPGLAGQPGPNQADQVGQQQVAQRRQRIAGDADQPGHHDLRGAAERGDAGRIDQGKPVERSARGSFLPAARSAPRRSCHAGPRAGRGRRGRLPARGDGSLPAVPGTAPRAAPGAAGSARRGARSGRRARRRATPRAPVRRRRPASRASRCPPAGVAR